MNNTEQLQQEKEIYQSKIAEIDKTIKEYEHKIYDLKALRKNYEKRLKLALEYANTKQKVQE